jgi:hypothetical protein
MAVDKLQEAISLIKSGDKGNGQRLLTEVLGTDPRNELAWLWMSTLVTGDKRRYCLEKALGINPNNVHARGQLEQLVQAQERSTPPPPHGGALPFKSESATAAREIPETQNTPLPFKVESRQAHQSAAAAAPTFNETARETTGKQVWLISGRNLSTVIYLAGNDLLAVDEFPAKVPQLMGYIEQGMTPKQLYDDRAKLHLTTLNYIPLTKVREVAVLGDVFKITAVDGSGKEKKIGITCNKEHAPAVLKALQQNLGPQFTSVTRPISRVKVMASALVVFLVTSCGTGFFYWLVQGLAEEERIAGSVRSRAIGNLLLLIGPNGGLCIGGGILLLVIISVISSLAKPPQETVLTRSQGLPGKA